MVIATIVEGHRPDIGTGARTLDLILVFFLRNEGSIVTFSREEVLEVTPLLLAPPFSLHL